MEHNSAIKGVLIDQRCSRLQLPNVPSICSLEESTPHPRRAETPIGEDHRQVRSPFHHVCLVAGAADVRSPGVAVSSSLAFNALAVVVALLLVARAPKSTLLNVGGLSCGSGLDVGNGISRSRSCDSHGGEEGEEGSDGELRELHLEGVVLVVERKEESRMQ